MWAQNISADIGKAPSTLKQLGDFLNSSKCGLVLLPDICEKDLVSLENLKEKLSQLYQQWQTIFVWQDGPLVQAMKNGDLFLVDEISLADDSVLERLNSVLEPDRKLVSLLFCFLKQTFVLIFVVLAAFAACFCLSWWYNVMAAAIICKIAFLTTLVKFLPFSYIP